MTNATATGPTFVRLPDDKLTTTASIVGHLNGYGVARMSTLKTGPSDKADTATLTVYELFGGLVTSIDEAGEATDHTRRGWVFDEFEQEEVEVDLYDAFEDVLAGHVAQGWTVASTETFASRVEAVKAQRQAVKDARVARERAGYREWGLTHGGEEVTWFGREEDGEAAAREALTWWGGGACLVFHDVGPVTAADA